MVIMFFKYFYFNFTFFFLSTLDIFFQVFISQPILSITFFVDFYFHHILLTIPSPKPTWEHDKQIKPAVQGKLHQLIRHSRQRERDNPFVSLVFCHLSHSFSLLVPAGDVLSCFQRLFDRRDE